MFNISYLIIILWFATTDVIIEFQEVEFMTPRRFAPFLKLLNLVQLGITAVYTLLYCKIKYELAQYRANKQEEEEIKEELRV